MQIKESEFKLIIADFVRLSTSTTCPNCERTTKFVGETRDNGNWICPWCYSVFPIKNTAEIITEVPFVKLTDQLINQPLAAPLGDPPSATFPMNTTTGFLVPSYSYKFRRKRRILLAEMDDFTRAGRIKSGSIWQFDLVWSDRSVAEYEALVEFIDVQGYHLPFNYTDVIRGSNHVCFFDSDASEFDTQSFDDGNFSVRITE
jgi:hypothetical protein